ncbi:MAG: polysaccharide deacetylase family protein [Candidatus Nanopelagicales bacterium]
MSSSSRVRDFAPGIAVAVAFLVAGTAGFAVGAVTSSPEPAAATEVTASPSATATATSSAPAPLPTPSDDAYVATLDDSLEFGSETLAEGQSGRSETNVSDSDLQVLNWVETDDPVFFITIDDGLVDSPAVLDFIERNQIPVTAFLTEYAVRNKTDYFEAATAFGGSVQNHTMVHGALDDPATDVEWEICETQDRFDKQFGYTPWMLRPPYGAGPKDPEVLKYAEQCGINRIVLWNVVVTDDNQIEYWAPPIKAGDIVLLHWVDGMEVGLQKVLELGKAQGLTPAALEDYI